MSYICPICGKEYSKPPALSRTDNQTPICPTCGMKEALSAAGISDETSSMILSAVEDHSEKE